MASYSTLKDDLVAAFSIALVTIPLSIGIAVASGVPPMAGIFSAIIGGLVATLVRGSHLTINGPAASLIVVTISAIQIFGSSTDPVSGFKVFLAASICAGGLLMLLSLLRVGRYGDLFSTAIIYGIIGAIGLIILSKQLPVAFGVENWEVASAFEGLMRSPDLLWLQNPFIGIIAILSFIILFWHNKVQLFFVKIIPAPVWVILLSIVLALIFQIQEDHIRLFFGLEYNLGPEFLIEIPTDVRKNILFPDFSQIDSFAFWQIVVVITLIIYIETLISAKAMDKIDPLQRQTNVNRDLFACGLTTVLSSAIGGLPVITAVPLYYGAKTKTASLMQGAILLLFIFVLPVIVHEVPLAALAALLIYTGYQLASPKIFRDVYRLGFEQFVVLATTLVVILFQGVLLGTLVGFGVLFFIQYAKSNLTRRQFLKYLWKPEIELSREGDDVYIKTSGVFNFVNILPLKQVLRSAKAANRITLDMSDTRLVDSTVLEYLHDEAERYDIPNAQFDIIGLDAHETSSRHPNAMHVLPENKKPQLTKRQEALEELAERFDGTYWPEIRWEVSQFKQFNFFQTRPIDYKLNTAKGNYHLFLEWESCDITLDQGTLFNTQEKHTSVILVYLPFNLPVFMLQKEGIMEKLGASLAFYKDIDFKDYPQFSKKYLLRGPNEEEIINYFNQRLLDFLEENESYYIESNGSLIMIAKEMRFASPFDMAKMHTFSSALSGVLLANWKEQMQELKASML